VIFEIYIYYGGVAGGMVAALHSLYNPGLDPACSKGFGSESWIQILRLKTPHFATKIRSFLITVECLMVVSCQKG
jgi:hypothetical protein